jgi:hypothetical protein
MISRGTSITVTTEPTPPEPKLRDIPDVVDSMLFCYECDDNAASSTVVDSHTNGYDGDYLAYNAPWDWDPYNTNTTDSSESGKLGEALIGIHSGAGPQWRCIDFTPTEPGGKGSTYEVDKNFSWSMWIKWPSVIPGGGGANARATYNCVIGSWPQAGSFLQLEWYDAGGGDWRLRWRSWDGTERGVYCSTDLSAYDDSFFHVVVTHDTSGGVNVEDRMKIYINGSDDTVKMGVAGVPATFANDGWDGYRWLYSGRPDINYNGLITMDQFIGWTKAADSIVSTIYNGGNGMAY